MLNQIFFSFTSKWSVLSIINIVESYYMNFAEGFCVSDEIYSVYRYLQLSAYI